ncbi:MAG: large conductance mechanosensitive channel protein MscL [Thermoleophilia bacterium]|nr:large conductance mechanosensitive channel protein MscL [Thermoleophilia bacterium]
MIKEFRDFLLRGNIIELAVAVIAGAAFTQIVNSLVKDIITPLIGLVFGAPDFGNLVLFGKTVGGHFIWFTSNALGDGVTQGVMLGNFLNAVVAFALVMSGVFFLVVKPVNALTARITPPTDSGEPDLRECPECMSKISAKARRCAFCTTELAPAARA